MERVTPTSVTKKLSQAAKWVVDQDVRDNTNDLVDRLRKGDPAAFDGLFERFRPRLYGFLLRMIRRQGVAEELLQETWIRLARAAPSLPTDVKIGPWIFRVARNLAIDDLRRRRLESALTVDWWSLRREPDPFDELAGSELQARLERLIKLLPPKYREVVLLIVVEGMTDEEAALALGAKPATLRKRLSRAREIIRSELDKIPSLMPSERSYSRAR